MGSGFPLDKTVCLSYVPALSKVTIEEMHVARVLPGAPVMAHNGSRGRIEDMTPVQLTIKWDRLDGLTGSGHVRTYTNVGFGPII